MAADIRQAEIEQDDVDRLVLGQDGPILPAGSGQQLVAGRRQSPLEDTKDRGLILDRQNVHRAECSGAGSNQWLSERGPTDRGGPRSRPSPACWSPSP